MTTQVERVIAAILVVLTVAAVWLAAPMVVAWVLGLGGA